MDKAIIYIHGKGGSSKDATHYITIFKDCDVIGSDYMSKNPWEAKKEFPEFFDKIYHKYKSVEIIASSIGAFFTMNSLADKRIAKAYFISPIVDMEKRISDMMMWGNITEKDLCNQKEIKTDFGETLSWEYLCYVKENPIKWKIPTHILYGGKDNLTSYETISGFANKINATLTIMQDGEHWFHTEKQMKFLDEWISQYINL